MEKVDVKQMAGELESKSAEEVLHWSLETFHPRIALASSFGPEDVVLIDMLVKINKKARIFTLDTGRLNQETYDVMDSVREKYGVNFEVMYPKTDPVQEMVRSKGMNLFYDSIENRKECCGIRKVEPLGRALRGLDAWITGLRREQSVTRTDVAKIETDEGHKMIKMNPIVDWTRQQVWDYIKKNDIPYNKLHDQGYPSIGCAPCTRAVKRGENERAGRWWWEDPKSKECGLHVKK
jgi:phosphoadenosine phosphosulfate reductase